MRVEDLASISHLPIVASWIQGSEIRIESHSLLELMADPPVESGPYQWWWRQYKIPQVHGAWAVGHLILDLMVVNRLDTDHLEVCGWIGNTAVDTGLCGNVRGRFGVGVPGANQGGPYVMMRAQNPWGWEPTANLEIWWSRRTHLAHYTRLPFWLIIGKDVTAAANAWHGGVPVEDSSPLWAPYQPVDVARVDQWNTKHERDWVQYEQRRWSNEYGLDSAGWIQGRYSKATGISGDQYVLGWYPTYELYHTENPRHASQLCSELAWELAIRPENLERMHHNHARGSDSWYYFRGMHPVSKNGLGRPKNGNSWDPAFEVGNTAQIEGYNEEHCKTTVAHLAHLTKHPWFVWMAREFGVLVQNIRPESTISEGGYFGGGFNTMRGCWRPLGTIWSCALASGDSDLDAYVKFWLERIETHPMFMPNNFRKPTDRPDEQLPNGATHYFDMWQSSTCAWLGEYAHRNPGEHGDRAKRILGHIQAYWIQGWRGTDPPRMEMPKRVDPEDPSIGASYGRSHSGLVKWCWGLTQITGAPGVSQSRLAQCRDAIRIEFPRVNEDKWTHGPVAL